MKPPRNQDYKMQNEGCKTHHHTGFTLFEVLIAVTIGSILILVSTIALRMGLSHMDRGEKWLTGALQETSAFDFFWQQVSAIRFQKLIIPAYLSEGKDAGEKKDEGKEKEEGGGEINREKVYFNGDVDSMSFISPLSLKRHYGYGLVVATYTQRYGYDGVDLVYKEKRLDTSVLSDLSEGRADLDREADEFVFFRGCDKITFEYLKVGNELSLSAPDALRNMNIRGLQEWVGIIEDRLPKAIRIVITKGEKTREMVAPIMVMYSL